MAGIILLLMIGIPLAEIGVFIEVGSRIGLLTTLAAIFVTALMGTALLRHQGLATLLRVRESLEQGRLPVDEVFDGLCLLVAGVLLLTPGFVTDAMGFLLFVPPVRKGLVRGLARYLVRSGRVHVQQWPPNPEPGPREPTRRGGVVIDGDYDDVTPPPDPGAGPTLPPSRWRQ